MKSGPFIGSVAAHVLKTLVYQWVVFAANMLKRFAKAFKGYCRYLKLPHPDQDHAGQQCGTITAPAFHRPDPCIYSQAYLLSLGLPVTWDNPDIVLKRNGVVATETELLPNTEYEIDATIWNNSYEAPVIGLKVIFSYLSFGIATTSTYMGTTFINLGVKGGPNHPALATMLWTTPATPGHYCIQVTLVWIDDANPNNNLGQNNTDVVAAHSPAVFHFQLRNDTKTSNTYTFQVDTYSIPDLPDCGGPVPVDNREPFVQRLRRIQSIHNRANYPIPAGWTFVITPAPVALAPNDEVDVAVSVEPPATFTGKLPFNVNAVYDGKYAGGVSLFVTKA
jgi:hypothetical protein